MRLLLAFMLALAVSASAAPASPAEVKAAKKAFQQGLKLQKQDRDAEAFKKFSEAADLDSSNLEYATAREIARQKLVYRQLQAGNQALLKDDRIGALASFHAASELDPKNQFAVERLRDAMSEPASQPSRTIQTVEQSDEIELHPRPGRQSFHYNGDTRGLLETVARSFGLVAIFDESFNARPVNFNVEGVEFSAAISLASRFAKAMWTPLSGNQIFIAQDTPENHRQFDHMSLRTFYVPDVSTPQEMNEIVSVFRGLFEIRHIVPNPGKSTITVRAPKPTVDVAAAWLSRLASGRAQIMLDVRAYEVNESLLRVLGVNLPLQFQIFNIPASALLLAQNPNIQELINQLISSGGINQANTEAISALLAQLQSQQSNPLLSQRFVTFGGGLTLFGIGVPGLSFTASLDKSQVTSLEHMTLRASEGNAATFRVGSRFPVLNGTFAPLINTPAINDLLTSQNFVAPFPSFTYEDLGISLKATPQVHSTTAVNPAQWTSPGSGFPSIPEVTLTLELDIRSLSGAALNGVPVISNREFTGAVRLREGEPAVVVGVISRSEQRSLSGLPGLGQLPLLKRAVTNENINVVEDQILLMITPYIVRTSETSSPTEIWLPSSM